MKKVILDKTVAAQQCNTCERYLPFPMITHYQWDCNDCINQTLNPKHELLYRKKEKL